MKKEIIDVLDFFNQYNVVVRNPDNPDFLSVQRVIDALCDADVLKALSADQASIEGAYDYLLQFDPGAAYATALEAAGIKLDDSQY